MTPREWAARLRPGIKREHCLPSDRITRTWRDLDWHELADLLDLLANYTDAKAAAGRAGGLKTAAGMTVEEKRARAAKAARARWGTNPHSP